MWWICLDKSNRDYSHNTLVIIQKTCNPSSPLNSSRWTTVGLSPLVSGIVPKQTAGLLVWRQNYFYVHIYIKKEGFVVDGGEDLLLFWVLSPSTKLTSCHAWLAATLRNVSPLHCRDGLEFSRTIPNDAARTRRRAPPQSVLSPHRGFYWLFKKLHVSVTTLSAP